jgi:geranylgeranyl pyrophosphate synthase
MVTVPLAIALERDRSLRRQVRALWSDMRGGRDARPLLGQILERMERAGAFAATRRLASEDTARAVTALDALPPNRWCGHLRDLSLEMLQRAV